MHPRRRDLVRGCVEDHSQHRESFGERGDAGRLHVHGDETLPRKAMPLSIRDQRVGGDERVVEREVAEAARCSAQRGDPLAVAFGALAGG